MGDNLPPFTDASFQMHDISMNDVDAGGLLTRHGTMEYNLDNRINYTEMEEYGRNTVGPSNVDEVDQPLTRGDDEARVEEVDQLVVEPYVGREFSTYKEAYDTYNLYARHKGFSVRIYSTRRSRSTNEVIGRYYVCSREGLKKEKGKDNARNQDRRIGCTAKMGISLNQNSGKWVVSSFNDTHSHEFINPGKVGQLRSHRKFHRSKTVKTLIDELHEQGLTPSAISKVINVRGGNKDETITAQQCHDHLRVQRKNNIGRECVSMIKHFQDKRATDPSFYFAMEVDDNYRLKSVFWADGRSIHSYLQFGDVVVFDVAYRTNKFQMPFAPFTGVNHHRQSTLFGCALLADETEDTFVWLFEQWLKCMWGKAPGAIIADQDLAICNAIKKVFPQTRHRYCSWHVDKHIMEHLHFICTNHTQFPDDYQQWLKSKSISESNARWESLKEKYALHDNKWLMNMYEQRHHWVPVFLRDTFTAGMTSSQWSESINAFFDGYVHASTPLNEFVRQYDNALEQRRKIEYKEDFMTIDSEPRCVSELDIEVQAGKFYTRKLFELFQAEFNDSINCWREKMSKQGHVTTYSVGKSKSLKSKWRTVIYDISDGVKFTCECAKFETLGILCKHILCVMRAKQIDGIPTRYLLKRWSIDARYRVGNIDSQIVKSNETSNNIEISPLMMWSLRVKHSQMMNEVSSSLKLYNEYNSWMDSKLSELYIQKKAMHDYSLTEVGSNGPSSQCLEHMPEILVRDPSGPVKTKERPRTENIFQSPKEVVLQEREKPKRKCSHCGGLGHYRTGCPVLKESDKGKRIQIREEDND